MRICLDTNVLVRLFGSNSPFISIRQALLAEHLELAFSNEVMSEYQEVFTRLSGAERWRQVATLFELLERRHGNIIKVEPAFRFRVISADPDDNKFVDCAIAAGAEFIVTEDRHFAALVNAGYQPKPITPHAFIRDHLERLSL